MSRITNSLLQRQTLTNYQATLRSIHEAQKQVVSGSRIHRPSDDPVAAGTVVRTDSQLRAIEQYRRNIGTARTRLSAEESVLGSLTDLLTRARELAIANATGTANADTRAAAKAEVEQLLAEAIQLGNTRVNGSYLFGGAFDDRRPFDADGAFDPDFPPRDTGGRQVEIASGHLIATQHDGGTVFIDSEVFASLRELADALGANDQDAVSASIASVDRAFGAVQDLIAEVGARQNALDMAEANLEAWDVQLKTFRSDLSDVELEEALTRLIHQQTAYQAALAANARILQTSLTDYLR